MWIYQSVRTDVPESTLHRLHSAHFIATVTRALNRGNHRCERETRAQILKREPQRRQAGHHDLKCVRGLIDLWHRQMVSNVEELVWRDETLREKRRRYFGVERLGRAHNQGGMPQWLIRVRAAALRYTHLVRFVKVPDAVTLQLNEW